MIFDEINSVEQVTLLLIGKVDEVRKANDACAELIKGSDNVVACNGGDTPNTDGGA